MSPTLQFGPAAKGQVAEQGTIDNIMIMGKKVAVTFAAVLATAIGMGVAHGNVTGPLNQAAVDSNAAHYEHVMPPSFMQARGDETAAYKYDRLKNEDIGSTRMSDPKLAP